MTAVSLQVVDVAAAETETTVKPSCALNGGGQESVSLVAT
jgi:hypothetical protein